MYKLRDDLDLEILLVDIAKSGRIPPLFFVIAARQVPGYDIGEAENMENQMFNSDGFPIHDLS